MKTRTLLFALLGVAFLAVQVSAAVVVDDGETWDVTYPAAPFNNVPGTGGPFTMTYDHGSMTGDKTGLSFTTFCVQTNEYFTPGNNNLLVAEIGLETRLVDGNQDYNLTGYAAWVFDQFTQAGGLAAINGANDAAKQQNAYLLQQAIWAGMVRDPSGDGVGYASQVNTALSIINNATIENGAAMAGIIGTGSTDLSVQAWARTMAAGTIDLNNKSTWLGDTGLNTLDFGNGNVAILKMTTQGSSNTQDLIGYEDTQARVPEPASLLVWSLLGAGVAGAGARRKRRWSNKTRESINRIFDRS